MAATVQENGQGSGDGCGYGASVREGDETSEDGGAGSDGSPPTAGAAAEPEAKGFDRMDASQKLFVVLVSIFVACLLLGDITGGKAIPTFDAKMLGFSVGGPISVGMIAFPVTFLLTDVINDFYGRQGAKFVTWVGAGMAAFAWLLLTVTAKIPAHPDTYFTQEEYAKIFGGSAQLFVASIIAYLLGQLLDIHVFQFWKALTESRHLWLRATGSTILSQLIDTTTINTIFWRSTAKKEWSWIFEKILREYGLKVLIAIALTPFVYLVHEAVVRGLGVESAPHEGRRRNESS